ncbi:DUF4011 domain-containing protein [Paracoccus luteus]|uniref:DUF4011 domain-containing protein n=1 Tax=Paracoccus luteus TaxID=2508543 RepID=UPI001C7025C9|nr:DUF4011 domain-containing protein [Paracoccus luteus]
MFNGISPLAVALAAVTAVSAAHAQGQQPADLVVINGKVHTVNEDQPEASAFAVRDGLFVAVGNYDARTLEDEQGVNVLYLTLGALRWVDPNDRKNTRRAPLLLIPVALERGTAGERFRLRARPEDFAANLSLENFLDRLHGIRLPEVEPSEGFDLSAYLESVETAVEGKDGWGVERDVIVLSFFSFAKFMMYRGLDPANWPADAPLTGRPLLKGLLADGFERGEPLVPDDVPIDPIISPAEMHHILDSDSSQTLAVHEVRRGRNLVIQGPPGTGKSQTIANLRGKGDRGGRRC